MNKLWVRLSIGFSVMVLVAGFVVAAVSGYVCIRWLLNYLARRPLYVFAAYCLLFGLINLAVALVRG